MRATGYWDIKQRVMRPFNLSQIARVALVAPPAVRLGSIGILLDCLEMTRSHIWRQYSAIDDLSAADKFDVSRIRLVSVDGRPPRTEGGFAFPVDGGLGDEAYDIVAIADHATSDQHYTLDEPLPAWVRRQHTRGAVVASCGASVAFLAASGICDGLTVSAPPFLVSRLAARWPAVRFEGGRDTSESENVLSGRGGLADFVVASRLVEVITSRNTARWLDGQLGLSISHQPGHSAADDLFKQAQEWMADRYSQPIRIEEMATALGVDRRTLHRHFVKAAGQSPIAFLQSLRIEAAKRMLERTSFPIERIGALVGYADAAFFRETFRRSTSKNPRDWRRSSRASQP